jgi:hypothetical protein
MFKPGLKDGQDQTGLIALSSAPKGAEIYLEKSKYSQKAPAVIKDLAPGAYTIKLKLKDYNLWQDKLEVLSKKNTIRQKILLIPDRWKQEELAPDGFLSLIPVSFGKSLLIVKGKRITDYFIYDLQSQSLKPLLPRSSKFSGAKVLFHFTMPGSPAILLCLESYQGRSFIWLKDSSYGVEIEDITELFPEYPLRVIWDPYDPGYLYAFQNGYINLIDIAKREVFPNYFDKVRGYGVFNKKLYVIKDIRTFLRIGLHDDNEELISDDPVLGNFLFRKEGFFQIKPLSKDIIVFLGEKGELTSNQLPHRFADQGVLNLKHYTPTKRSLFWQKDKLGVIDFSTMEVIPIRYNRGPLVFLDVFEGGAQHSVLFDNGRFIEQAFWVYEGTHILLKDEDDVLLFELIPRKDSRVNYIVKVKEDSAVYYSDLTGKLYFIDRITNRLSSIVIVPRSQVVLKPFPKLKKK